MKLMLSNVLLSAILSMLLVSAPVHAEKNKQDGPGKARDKGPFVTLQLLGFNDYHGHIKTDAVGFRVT